MTLRVDTVITGLSGVPHYSRQIFPGETLIEAEDAVDVVGTMWTNLATGGTPLLSGGAKVDVQPEVTVFREDTGQPLAVLVTGGFSVTAAPSGTTVPAASQGLVRLLTSDYIGSRRVKGKIFIPGIAVSNITGDGLVGSTAQGAMEAAAQGLIGGGVQIWSRPTPERIGTVHDVASVDAWDQWAVLRSRRD